MLRVTAEEAARYRQRRNMYPRTKALFRRASRLCRRALRVGTQPAPDCLIATHPRDLSPRGALLAAVGLSGCPAEDLLARADALHYAWRWKTFELHVGAVIVLLPDDGWLPAALRAELRLGHAPVTCVPFGSIAQAVTGRDVRWARLRAAGDGAYHLRVRLRDSEVRTRIPREGFPQPADIARFVRRAVGEDARYI